MLCSFGGVLKYADLVWLVASELSESLFAQLQLFGTVEDQVKYYDDTIDMKHIEQVIIKPRIQEFKKANKPAKAEKPKKERKPKEKKDGSSTPVLPKMDANQQPAAPKKSRKPTEIVFSHDDDEVSKKLEFDEELPTEEYVVTTEPEPEPEPKSSDGETTDAVTETESIVTKEPVVETKKTKVIKKREPKAKKAATETETDGEKPKKKRVTKI